MKVKVKKKRLNEEPFARQWVEAHKKELSLLEFSKSIGKSYNEVYGQFRHMIEKGIKLPPLRGQRNRESKQVERLNGLIYSLLQQQDQEDQG